MTKGQAITLIDDHKNTIKDPVVLLNWVWLRLIITVIPDDDWEACILRVAETM